MVLGFELDFGERKRGATTTPLLSAECQIQRQSGLSPRATRVLAGDFSATFWRHFERHLLNSYFLVMLY